MKNRLIAYGVVAALLVWFLARTAFRLPENACVATLEVARPWADSVLSPDGRFVAERDPRGGVAVSRVDGPGLVPVLTDTFAPIAARLPLPAGIAFSGHSAHLVVCNEEAFRVVDLETRQAVDGKIPPVREPVAADTESVSLDSAEPAPALAPGAPAVDALAELAGRRLARVFPSATARYLLLCFKDGEKPALLERDGAGYAFRSWLEVGFRAEGLAEFAGDDSFVLLAPRLLDGFQGSSVKLVSLPAGKTQDLNHDGLTTTLGAHPLRAEFVLCWKQPYSGTGGVGFFAPGLVPPMMVSRPLGTEAVRAFAHSELGRVLYPVVRTWALQLEFANGDTGEVDAYSLEHDGEFTDGKGAVFQAAGLEPEGRFLRIVTTKLDEKVGAYVIRTLDLRRAAVLAESQQRRFNARMKWGVFLAVVAVALAVETGARLLRRRRELEERKPRELLAACERGDLATVATLIQGRAGRARLETRNARGFTPLLIASGLGHEKLVELLLAAGAETEAMDPGMSGTALVYACCAANGKAAALQLIANGAAVRACAKGGVSVAKVAAERGWADVLAAVAAKDPSALAMPTDDGVTPAYAAVEGGHTACFELCVKHAPRALAHQRKTDGATPAYVAAFHGRDEMLATIARVAPETLRVPGPGGYLPATIAALKGHVGCVRLLAAAAPETFAIGIAKENGITPAFLAAQNGHDEVLELIAGVAPATLALPRANDAVTPAYQAAFKGYERCLDVIGRHAPESLRRRNGERRLPAFVAAQNGHVAALEALRRWAPETLADTVEGSPAFIAAQMGQIEAVRYLLATVPESFDATLGGGNPAHAAAALGHEEVYRVLAEGRPGLLAVANSAGKTPPDVLAAAQEEAKAEQAHKAEQKAKRRADDTASGALSGIVFWGVGFKPDQAMLMAALMALAQGNATNAVLLMALPAELERLTENPSEVEARLLYRRIADRKRWKRTEPKLQFVGLPDGRKFLLAYPPLA